MLSNETIAAISTPIGMGGIGIIRLSGPDAMRVAAGLLGVDPAVLAGRPSHSVFYAKIADPALKQTIDECLVTLMRGPRSYTREDVVEINVHSGTPTLKMVLERVIGLGARLAEPGEFTKRAFLSGRLDLTQAQAVGALIRARSEAAARAAARQAEGYLSQRIATVRESLLNTAAQLEAAVDFSDEDINPGSLTEIVADIAKAGKEIDCLIEAAERGKIYESGLRTAIIGRPNVGKSSLLNTMSREERAIVSPQPGTTRDIIEATVLLGDIPLLLRDTAGWRLPLDDIEAEGVTRSRAALESADLVLLVLDGSEPLRPEDAKLFAALEYDKPLIVVVNKSDLPMRLELSGLPERLRDQPLVRVSALERDGLDELEGRVAEAVGQSAEPEENEMILADARQREALKAARADVAEAAGAAGQGYGEEILAPLVKEAIRRLASITGENVDEEVLDRIFSRFCIGK